ncbi:MAG: NAD-dependent protein deacylase, partial [Deltaproteobacteria bacterium]
ATIQFSSFVVPAPGMEVYAKEARASLVIVNMSPTQADKMADVIIHDSAGETMGRILTEVRKRLA